VTVLTCDVVCGHLDYQSGAPDRECSGCSGRRDRHRHRRNQPARDHQDRWQTWKIDDDTIDLVRTVQRFAVPGPMPDGQRSTKPTYEPLLDLSGRPGRAVRVEFVPPHKPRLVAGLKAERKFTDRQR
jgi:hypothetical protein